MTKGSREASFRSMKSVSEVLAEEIIAASKVFFIVKDNFCRDPEVVQTATLSRRRMRSRELPRVTDDFRFGIILRYLSSH